VALRGFTSDEYRECANGERLVVRGSVDKFFHSNQWNGNFNWLLIGAVGGWNGHGLVGSERLLMTCRYDDDDCPDTWVREYVAFAVVVSYRVQLYI